MAESGWTLEGELCGLTGCGSAGDALRAMGLVDADEDGWSLDERQAWTRGGSETYIYGFDVLVRGKRRHSCVIKAMVAPTPGTPPGEQLAQWLERRRVAAAVGVPMPKLYGAGNAVLVEQHIADDATDVIRQQSVAGAIESDTIADVEKVCRLIYEAGFRPLGILSNIRHESGRFYWVDFGGDLGEATLDEFKPNAREIVSREINERISARQGRN